MQLHQQAGTAPQRGVSGDSGLLWLRDHVPYHTGRDPLPTWGSAPATASPSETGKADQGWKGG